METSSEKHERILYKVGNRESFAMLSHKLTVVCALISDMHCCTLVSIRFVYWAASCSEKEKGHNNNSCDYFVLLLLFYILFMLSIIYWFYISQLSTGAKFLFPFRLYMGLPSTHGSLFNHTRSVGRSLGSLAWRHHPNHFHISTHFLLLQNAIQTVTFICFIDCDDCTRIPNHS